MMIHAGDIVKQHGQADFFMKKSGIFRFVSPYKVQDFGGEHIESNFSRLGTKLEAC